MDTRFLESLLAVVEVGSIAGAARQQGLTAAAVSQRVKVLEAELGCPLLVRSAQSAKPTGECLRMLPAAKALIRDAQRLSVHVAQDGLKGPYRLGAISTALLDYVPKLVRQFRSTAPDVEFTVQPGSSQTLYESFRAGGLDAVLVVAPPFSVPKEVRLSPVAKEPLCRIRPMISEGECKSGALPWLVYDRSTWGGRHIAGQLERIQGNEPVLCELDSLETIAAMVEEGLGQAIVPVWACLAAQYKRLQIEPLTSDRPQWRSIVLLQNTSSSSAAIDLHLAKSLLGDESVMSELNPR